MPDRPADNLQELPQQIQRMLDHYRLVDNPFGKAVDAKVFSRTGNRAAVASQIENLFRATSTVCLLIAPADGGKRTLARQVARQLGPDWRVAWIDAQDPADPGDLVRDLAGQLRLDYKLAGAPEEVSRRIAELIARKGERGEHCLLVVQNADRLSPAMKDCLASLETHGVRPELRLRQLWLAESLQAMDQAEVGDPLVTVALDPLSDAEAVEYLRDRFAAAGRFEGLPIEEGEVARINRIAGGWPGRLNEAARDYLIAANKRALEWRPATGLLYALIGIAVLTAVAVTMVRYGSTQSGTKTADQSAAQDPEPAPDQAGLDSAIDEPGADSQRSASERKPVSLTAGEDDEVVAVTGGQSRDTGAARADPEPIPSDEGGVEPTRPDEDHAEPTTKNEGDAELASTDERDAEPTRPDENDARAQAARERPVYTVQLAGARSHEALATLTSALDRRIDTRIAHTTHQGEPWYVLISGRYETVAQARVAISRLPPELRARSPWPRNLSELEVLDRSSSSINEASGTPAAETMATEEGTDRNPADSRAPFTLQLAGVRNRGSLEALVAELENPERYEIITATLEGRPWYVLTHGRFETVEAARAAMERLPEELKRYSPWPRPLSDFAAAPAAAQED